MTVLKKESTRAKRANAGARTDAVPTLAMVAKEAGVSTSTVSRFISGTINVSDVHKSNIEAAIAKFKFRPNPAARGLALGKTLTIGVVTQSIDSPFYAEGLRGVEDYLLRHGYAPLFMSGNWREEDETRCMTEFVARRVDGIIMFAGSLSDKALADYAKQVPIVITGRRLKAKNVCCLSIDDQQGAKLATQHLIELGHRKIAFVAGVQNHPDAIERLTGYKQALALADIPFEPRLVAQGDFHEEGGMRAARHLIESKAKFSALFCVNDQTAHGACLALYRHGLRIPDDVSVVGFDDLPSSQYCLPPLTTVRQSVHTLGESSAQAIIQLINGQRPKFALPPVELVVRESTKKAGGKH